MSAGDVVCTGWLIKSPPEKKLKRFTWRKRWFVLRRGRMSGNPDVLEYYQSKSSKKPIRTIDLKECEVQMQSGQLRLKREYLEKHLFLVKTSFRIFYLVAKTEEEMNSWIKSISQICQFGPLENTAESSEEAACHTPTSHQPPPANDDGGSISSQLDYSHPMDYLFLSQCETGECLSISRCESFSTSERSLEQKSSDDSVTDVFSSPLCANSSPSYFSHTGSCPSVFTPGRLTNPPPVSAPCNPMALASSSSSSPLLRHCASSIFQFDIAASLEATADRLTPPPLPPKPNQHSEQLSTEGARAMTAQHLLSGHAVLVPRRISVSGLDRFRIGEVETNSMRNTRSPNVQPSLNPNQIPNYQEELYIPMASPPAVVTGGAPDGYIPMSPRIISFLNANCTAESPMTLSPVVCRPGDLAPPPINRHLKPRRRARPPPLDLRGLSTITECPTHLPLSRAMTEPGRQPLFLSIDGTVQSWGRRSHLDYLSLDFNAASPSPVQKKPFLSDEHRVDYVKVDEQKTQALQSTKMEWSDVRQSQT
ncbi:GRB2-associated-binding protein 3 [Diretmus argenteus]